jgi:heterodisulfide reductase subunit A
MEAHQKLRPVEFATEGVFLCGMGHYPKPLEESIAQAQAAASKALTVLSRDHIMVGGIVSHIEPERCSGCLGCINVCPYNAITYNAEKKLRKSTRPCARGAGPVRRPVRRRPRCCWVSATNSFMPRSKVPWRLTPVLTGNMSQFRRTGPTVQGADREQKPFEPKILAFICNWCAYGAADLAGVSRMQYPPNVRAIRVMCSATVSPHHILRALQDGADGILVGG